MCTVLIHLFNSIQWKSKKDLIFGNERILTTTDNVCLARTQDCFTLLPEERATLEVVCRRKNSGVVLGLTVILAAGASTVSVHVNDITVRWARTVSASTAAPGRFTRLGGWIGIVDVYLYWNRVWSVYGV